MPSALRRPLALSVCTAANDRGMLVWENPGEQRQVAGAVNVSRGTSRGWQPGPWSGYKDYSPPFFVRTIPAPVYQLGARSRTVNCDRSRDSSFGCVGRNRRCEDRDAGPNDQLRILDSEGREVFSRRRGDRLRKHK